jgi:hypothetical protein
VHFVNPYFLFGLLALSVPIIVHLFNFRKFKRVYFTNVKFLQELQEKTKKQSQLKHIVILLLRLLAILSIVLAFAQPFIPVSKTNYNAEKGNAVSIYIDNSFSMEADGSSGLLIDEAKSKALEILKSYSNADMFQILTNDFDGKHQRFVSKDEFVELLEEIKISPSFRKLSEVDKRQSDLINSYPAKNKVSFVISDFQKTFSDVDKLKSDTTRNIFLLPLVANKVNNVYIDSCWFTSPIHQAGQTVKLHIKLKNISEIDFEKVPLKLMISNNQKAVSSFNIGAKAETEVVLSYIDNENGIHQGYTEIVDNPITYDNKFYFSYNVSARIPVLGVNGNKENVFLNSLLGKDSAFAFVNMSDQNIDYSSFSKYRLIIINELDKLSTGLNEEIQKFVGNGGSLLVIPPAKLEVEEYKSFLISLKSSYYTGFVKGNKKLSSINTENPVYSDVFESIPENIDLPVVTQYYSVSKTSFSSQEYLLKMQGDDIFMNVQPSGNGFVYLLAVPLDPEFSSFPKHAIFVPTIYKIALLSEPAGRLYYYAGSNEMASLRNLSIGDDEALKLKQLGTDYEVIPEMRKTDNIVNIYFHDQIKDAGNYQIYSGSNELSGVSFNYNRDESDIECYKSAELKKLIDDSGLENCTIIESRNKNITDVLNELNMGIKLWKIFIILALIFLAVEVILLRLWK